MRLTTSRPRPVLSDVAHDPVSCRAGIPDPFARMDATYAVPRLVPVSCEPAPLVAASVCDRDAPTRKDARESLVSNSAASAL